MLRRDGYVKILDFGLAKLSEELAPAAQNNPARVLVKTHPGVLMGTATYMSPEQARGLKVDARSDIWSLGVVLYEMLTGRVPFEGGTTTDVILAIVEKKPPPLANYAREAPEEIERIVIKALCKEKEKRYQVIKDLLVDLKSLKQNLELQAGPGSSAPKGSRDNSSAAAGERTNSVEAMRVATTAVKGHEVTRSMSSAEYLISEAKRHKPAAAVGFLILLLSFAAISYFNRERATVSGSEVIDSVAVLPFVNVGNDPSTEYLSDGISDSIINSLSQLSALKVMSLNSVLPYKGKPVDPREVGKALNVRAVLVGRLQQRGDELTVSTELVDARDNRRLWGQQYNRKPSDILLVQNEIASEIAERLRQKLSSQERKQLAKNYTDNKDAYQLYSMGMYHARKRTKEGIEQSFDFFNQAIKMDPKYPLAYLGLGRAYAGLYQLGLWLPKEAHEKMEWAILKAIELDDTLAGAHAFLGYVKKNDWDWADAETEFKRALELDPNAFEPNYLYYAFLRDLGRPDEAFPYARRAEELGGVNPEPGTAVLYYNKGEYDKAIELLLKALEKNPKAPFAETKLAQAYLGKKMYNEAIAELQKVMTVKASETWSGYPLLAYVYGQSGRRTEALKILQEQKTLAKQRYISPFNLAVIYFGLGENDKGFEYVDKAYEERSPSLLQFVNQSMFRSLRSDPRYRELLRRMKL
jgi:TolB-like protein/Flp pilus assembly protein TadD